MPKNFNNIMLPQKYLKSNLNEKNKIIQDELSFAGMEEFEVFIGQPKQRGLRKVFNALLFYYGLYKNTVFVRQRKIGYAADLGKDMTHKHIRLLKRITIAGEPLLRVYQRVLDNRNTTCLYFINDMFSNMEIRKRFSYLFTALYILPLFLLMSTNNSSSSTSYATKLTNRDRYINNGNIVSSKSHDVIVRVPDFYKKGKEMEESLTAADIFSPSVRKAGAKLHATPLGMCRLMAFDQAIIEESLIKFDSHPVVINRPYQWLYTLCITLSAQKGLKPNEEYAVALRNQLGLRSDGDYVLATGKRPKYPTANAPVLKKLQQEKQPSFTKGDIHHQAPFKVFSSHRKYTSEERRRMEMQKLNEENPPPAPKPITADDMDQNIKLLRMLGLTDEQIKNAHKTFIGSL